MSLSKLAFCCGALIVILFGGFAFIRETAGKPLDMIVVLLFIIAWQVTGKK